MGLWVVGWRMEVRWMRVGDATRDAWSRDGRGHLFARHRSSAQERIAYFVDTLRMRNEIKMSELRIYSSLY